MSNFRLIFSLLLAILLSGCSGEEKLEILACDLLSATEVAEMDRNPLYYRDDIGGSGACIAINSPNEFVNTGDYFSDSSCSNQISFVQTDFITECQGLLGDNKRFGYADWEHPDPLDTHDSSPWMLSQLSRLRASSVDQTVHHQPYFKRVLLKDFGNGCRLEIDVYKEDINATGLKAAIYYHGGSWNLRDSSTFSHGEISPNFTGRGYVFFAPFYRLAVTDPVAADCEGTMEELIEDTQTAVNWVMSNGADYGADTNQQIVLMGSSAGGHISGLLSLDINNNNIISDTILLYPATDLSFFINNYESGLFYRNQYTSTFNIVRRALGVTAEELMNPDVDLQNRLENISMFNKLEDPTYKNNLTAYPKIHMIGGSRDSLIPPEGYFYLHETMAGRNVPSPPSVYDGSINNIYQQVRNNGTNVGSVLLVGGADHILDLKCFFSDRMRAILTPIVASLSGGGMNF